MTKIYEAENYILIHSGYHDPAAHRHQAAHAIISLGSDFETRAGECECRCKGIVIPAKMRHEICSNDMPMLVFLFDSTTPAARNITEPARIPDEIAETIALEYRKFETTGTAQAYKIFENTFTKLLGMTDFKYEITDKRILNAISYISNNITQELRCADLAGLSQLSESRFSHLFKEQMGMTFASYMVFRRLMCGYAAIIKGCSITEAALYAGFSGSSHFADVNRKVFGISAKDITKNLQFTKMF